MEKKNFERQRRLNSSFTPISSRNGPYPENITDEQSNMMKWQGLSALWKEYADLLSKSSVNNAEQLSKDAYTTSAEYLRRFIDVVEKE